MREKKRERIMTVISPYYDATSFLLFHSPTPLGCDAPSRGGQARNTSLHHINESILYDLFSHGGCLALF